MNGINEVNPQTFGLISTSKMNFLKNFPHFFLFLVPNFRIGQKLPRAALAPLASFSMSEGGVATWGVGRV